LAGCEGEDECEEKRFFFRLVFDSTNEVLIAYQPPPPNFGGGLIFRNFFFALAIYRDWAKRLPNSFGG